MYHDYDLDKQSYRIIQFKRKYFFICVKFDLR